MKPVRFRPAAQADLRREVAWYRREAGENVASRLVQSLRRAQERIAVDPGLGSPRVGQVLEIPALRAWALDGFPMSLWYFERPDHVDIVRLVAHRQHRERIDLE